MADSTSSRTPVADALARFAGDVTADQRRLALTELISSKFLPKHADDALVAAGRSRLLHCAIHGQDPVSRLLGIAELIRLVQVVKRWVPDVVRDLGTVFSDELPPLRLLPEADDRLNLARACAYFRHDWLLDYVAQAIADEEQGEKARAELVESLLERSPSIADALRLLSTHFEAQRPTTDAPGDSLAKRIARTLAGLRSAILESDCETGPDLGPALYGLVTRPLSSVLRPQNERTKIDLSREVILTVHDIVRTRLSVVTDPAMYRAVGYCRQLCGNTWPDDLKKPLDQLIADVSEALVLLGRQGQRDQDLLGQLEVLCKHPERAKVLARQIAAKHPELPDDVRDWLEHGRVRQQRVVSDTAAEAAASSADASMGLAMQAARQARGSSAALHDRLISSLEIHEPSLVSATEECLAMLKIMVVQVEQAASIRNLGLLGTPGEETEASAKFFETVGNSARQKIVVKQPAVVRMRADGTIGEVVLKGLAE